jgi:hypothetical protein
MDQNTTIAKKEITRSADRDKPWLPLASEPEEGGGGGDERARRGMAREERTAWRRGGRLLYGKGGTLS